VAENSWGVSMFGGMGSPPPQKRSLDKTLYVTVVCRDVAHRAGSSATAELRVEIYCGNTHTQTAVKFLTVHELKTLRAHGMNAECFNNVCYHPCQTYGACAWIGFTHASERDRSVHTSMPAFRTLLRGYCYICRVL